VAFVCVTGVQIVHASDGVFVASARRHFVKHFTLADVVKKRLNVGSRPICKRGPERKVPTQTTVLNGA